MGPKYFKGSIGVVSIVKYPFFIHVIFWLKKTVASFWSLLKDKGFIHKTAYSGWYCVQDETFLTETQIVEDSGKKLSAESGHPVEWTQEENYVFKMGQFKDPIRNWLDDNSIIRPSIFRNHLKMFLDQGIYTIRIINRILSLSIAMKENQNFNSIIIFKT